MLPCFIFHWHVICMCPEIKRLMSATTALYRVRQLSFRNVFSSVRELWVIGFVKSTTMRTTIKINTNHYTVLEWDWREIVLFRAKFLDQDSGSYVTVQNLRSLVPPTVENVQCIWLGRDTIWIYEDLVARICFLTFLWEICRFSFFSAYLADFFFFSWLLLIGHIFRQMY